MCAGSVVMRDHESHESIIQFIRIHFRRTPQRIYYDNACNLKAMAVNRDPETFKNCQFMCAG